MAKICTKHSERHESIQNAFKLFSSLHFPLMHSECFIDGLDIFFSGRLHVHPSFQMFPRFICMSEQGIILCLLFSTYFTNLIFMFYIFSTLPGFVNSCWYSALRHFMALDGSSCHQNNNVLLGSMNCLKLALIVAGINWLCVFFRVTQPAMFDKM